MEKQQARDSATYTKHIDGKFTIMTVTIGDLKVPARYETAKAPERYGDVPAYEERLKEGILNVAIGMLFPEDEYDNPRRVKSLWTN